MFWRRRLTRAADVFREQRDSARRQRDRLVARVKRLSRELSQERQQALLPPYSSLSTGPAASSEDQIWWPERLLPNVTGTATNPGPDVAFVTVANDRFLPGLEALLLSLRAVYPELSSPVVVFHDGSLGSVARAELEAIHPRVRFEVPHPSWADALPLDSPNRERIGLLGYLNTYAFALEGFRRVIVLDSDVLVLGPLDPLWAPGEAFRAVPDCGALPYGLVSAHTGKPVLNSGMISIPGWALGPAMLDRMHRLISLAAQPVCPLLDSFADQKVWNLLFAEHSVELMPVNFNCNIKYVVQFLEGCTEGLSLVHFAGPKPWLRDAQPRARSKSVVDHWLWIRHHRELLCAERLRQYEGFLASRAALPELVPAPRSRPALLADDPAALRLELPTDHGLHLLLPSADTSQWPPSEWPSDWQTLVAELAEQQPLHLWAPFCLRSILASLVWHPAIRLEFILLERPFSAPDLVDQGGCAFVPWRGSLRASLRAAVERRLQAMSIRWVGS